MKREYKRWHSPSLGRDMELLVFGHAGTRVLVFPTRCGRFHDYEDWGIVSALRHKIESGHFQLFCLDSIDNESFYCDWCPPKDRVLRHLRYEEYILNEVIPFTQSINHHQALIAHGCSMGAFHAVNIAFRHPHLFCKVTAFSGRYDLTKQIGTFRDLFDGFYDEDVYFNTPSHFVPKIIDPELRSHIERLDVVLTIGQTDAFLDNNLEFVEMLRDKGLHPVLHIWAGEAHKARAWRAMVVHYL